MKSAEDDIETVEILFEKEKFLHGLFFLHLAVEKALKSYVVKVTEDYPPKTHKLQFLAGMIDIEFESDVTELFGKLMKFQLEHRFVII